MTHLRSSRAEVATDTAAVVILTWRDLSPKIRTPWSLSLECAGLSALLTQVRASCARIGSTVSCGGGFHLRELASNATRVGLSNLRFERRLKNQVGVGHLGALAFHLNDTGQSHERVRRYRFGAL